MPALPRHGLGHEGKTPASYQVAQRLRRQREWASGIENGRLVSLTHTTRAIPRSSLSRTNSWLRDDIETNALEGDLLETRLLSSCPPSSTWTSSPHVPPQHSVWPCSRSRQPLSPLSPRASPSFSRHVTLHDHIATRCLVSSLISSLSFFSHSTQAPDIHPTTYVLLDHRGADTLPI